jgi:hypothetical protein
MLILLILVRLTHSIILLRMYVGLTGGLGRSTILLILWPPRRCHAFEQGLILQVDLFELTAHQSLTLNGCLSICSVCLASFLHFLAANNIISVFFMDLVDFGDVSLGLLLKVSKQLSHSIIILWLVRKIDFILVVIAIDGAFMLTIWNLFSAFLIYLCATFSTSLIQSLLILSVSGS